MAAVLQSPSLSGRDDAEGPITPNSGKDTLISHGGKWYNLASSADQTFVGSQKLESNGGVGSQRGVSVGVGGSHFERGRLTLELESSGEGDLATDETKGRGHLSTRSGDNNESLDGNAPTSNRTRQEDSEAWNGHEARVDIEREAAQLSPARILELASIPLSPSVSESSTDVNPHASPTHESSQDARGRAATTIPDEGFVNGNSV